MLHPCRTMLLWNPSHSWAGRQLGLIRNRLENPIKATLSFFTREILTWKHGWRQSKQASQNMTRIADCDHAVLFTFFILAPGMSKTGFVIYAVAGCWWCPMPYSIVLSASALFYSFRFVLASHVAGDCCSRVVAFDTTCRAREWYSRDFCSSVSTVSGIVSSHLLDVKFGFDYYFDGPLDRIRIDFVFFNSMVSSISSCGVLTVHSFFFWCNFCQNSTYLTYVILNQ